GPRAAPRLPVAGQRAGAGERRGAGGHAGDRSGPPARGPQPGDGPAPLAIRPGAPGAPHEPRRGQALVRPPRARRGRREQAARVRAAGRRPTDAVSAPGPGGRRGVVADGRPRAGLVRHSATPPRHECPASRAEGAVVAPHPRAEWTWGGRPAVALALLLL